MERAEERDAWLGRLRAFAPGASFETGGVSPLAILARGAGDARALPGFKEGAWSIQEEGSQVVALALGAKSGEQVLVIYKPRRRRDLKQEAQSKAR